MITKYHIDDSTKTFSETLNYGPKTCNVTSLTLDSFFDKCEWVLHSGLAGGH